MRLKTLSTKLTPKTATTGSIVVIALSALMTSFAISSVNILLPVLVTHFNTMVSHVQWVVISYMLFLTSTLIIAGRLSDILGYKRVFLMGVVIFTLSSSICAVTENLWLLVALRGIQGVGGAILVAVTMTMASNIFSNNKTAFVMGLIGSMSAIGTGLGPVLGGFIVDIFSWQMVFLINLPIGFLTYLLAHKYLPVDANKTENLPITLHYKSIFLLFLVILTYTLSIKLTEHGFGIINLILLSLSLLTLFLFIDSERQSTTPLLNLTVIKNRALSTSLVCNFIVSAVVMTSLIVGPFYLLISLECNTTQAGIVMATSPFTVAITSYLVGKLSRDKHFKSLIILGLSFLTLGATGMTLLKITDGLTGYLLCLITMATGYATFLSTNNTLTMSNTISNLRGSVAGILSLSRNLGLLTGASVMSTIFGASANVTNIIEAKSNMVVSGLHAVYQIAVGLLICAIAIQIINNGAQRH